MGLWEIATIVRWNDTPNITQGPHIEGHAGDILYGVSRTIRMIFGSENGG